MNVRRLRASNLRTFRELDLTLPEGCTAVTGEIVGAADGISSNGAGKSTIPLAVEVALFGPPPGFRTLEEFLSTGTPDGRVEVELEFEHAGEIYLIRRGWKLGKTSLDLEQRNGDGYEPLSRETTKETQRLIEDTVGLTQDTYRSSSYLAQGDTGFFAEALPSKRKAVLAEAVLGRDPVWPRLLGRVREDRQAAEKELAGVEARLEQAEEELAARSELENAFEFAGLQADDQANRLLGLEKYLDALVEEQQALERRTSERRAAEAEHQQAERERLRLREQAEQAASAAGSIRVAHETLVGLAQPDDLAAVEEAFSEARAAHDLAEHEYHVLRARTVALEDGGVCPTCLRPFEDHAELQAERERLLVELEAVVLPPRPDDGDVRRLRGEVMERARIETRVQAWQQTIIDAPSEELMREVAEIAFQRSHRLTMLPPVDPAEIERVQQQTLEARAQVAEQRQRLDQARTEKARLEERLDRLTRVAAEAVVWAQTQDNLRQQLDVLHLLDRAYGPNGIPSLLVENVAIPLIEQEANRILAELGTSFRVELRALREKKDGDLTDALDVVVVDAEGHERGYETYSGGEKTRLSIALRIALAVYIAGRGGDSRFLCIDEPEGLDEPGMAALAGVMRGLAGVFDRQLLISHVDTLRDAFDSRIHVVREDGVSRVAV